MKLEKEEKRILLKISKKFDEIEILFSNLENQTTDNILELHNETASLNHCIRWGNEAISDVLKEVKIK